jgi:hypothetical protein
VSRGAAKLMGFFNQSITSSSQKIHSQKQLDISQQHVDLVIPEIPAIACKRNAAGKEIIDRIPLHAGHGEYHYHYNTDTKHHYQNFFYPITISQLTIQLYAENNLLYDSQSTDNSFEFEFTMLRHDDL